MLDVDPSGLLQTQVQPFKANEGPRAASQNHCEGAEDIAREAAGDIEGNFGLNALTFGAAAEAATPCVVREFLTPECVGFALGATGAGLISTGHPYAQVAGIFLVFGGLVVSASGADGEGGVGQAASLSGNAILTTYGLFELSKQPAVGAFGQRTGALGLGLSAIGCAASRR